MNELVEELMKEGLSKDEAVVKAVAKMRGDGFSIANIATEGPYMYEEGLRFKKIEDLEEAYKNDEIFPVYTDHEKTKFHGLAYDFEKVDGAIQGKIYPPLKEGSGVSGGFSCVEVKCEEGVCQKQIKVDHVAASEDLIPRGADNVVLVSDMERIDSLEKELKDEKDRSAKLEAEIKKRDDALAAELREDLAGKVPVELADLCLHDLKLIKKVADSIVKPIERKEVRMNEVFA